MYHVDLLVDIVSSGAGAPVVRRWFTYWATVVTHPCVTGCCAGRPGHRSKADVTQSENRSGGVVDPEGRGCWRGWTYQRPPRDMASTACAHVCDPWFTCRSSRRVVPKVAMDMARHRYGHCQTPLWSLPDAARDIERSACPRARRRRTCVLIGVHAARGSLSPQRSRRPTMRLFPAPSAV